MFQIWHLYTLASIIYGVAGCLLLWKIPLTGPRERSKKAAALRQDPQPPPLQFSTLSVIIPARNEEKRLPALLQSLTGEIEAFQKGPDRVDTEIIVVDDGSADGTGELALSFGVTLIKLEEDAPGIPGKSRACRSGAEAAKGEMLLFLDADTWFTGGGLSRLLHSYSPGSLLSVQPYHVTKRFYESFSSYFNIIVMSGVNAFTPFSKSGKPKGCFGPCLLCSREVYFAAGGHGAIEAELVDDIALARLFLDKGYPVYCYGGKGCIEFRMYPEGIGDVVEGWTKNMATGAKFSSPLINILLFVWIAGVTNLFLSVIAGLKTGNPILIGGSALLYLAYCLQLFLHLRRIGKFSVFTLVFFPVYMLFFILLFLYSIVKTKIVKSVRWRGRDISL